MEPDRGDVLWSVDPFKKGSSKERPWLVLNNDLHPFQDEQSIVAALTTTPHLPAHPLREEYWEIGEMPEQSYVLPWAIHSLRHESVSRWQGRLETNFVDRVVDEAVGYLR